MIALSPGMRRSKGWSAGLAVAVGILGSMSEGGCSFMFVEAPPDGGGKLHSPEQLECSSGNGWPVTDVVVAGIMGVETLATLSEVGSGSTLSSNGQRTSADYVLPVVAAASTALFAASGISGFRRTSECRADKREIMARLYPNGPPGRPRGYAPYPVMAPPPYDPWTGQPVVPPGAAPPPGSEPA